MLTFFELAHILDATLLCFSCVHKHVDVTHLMHINMPLAFKPEIEKWKKLTPNARKTPSYFLCHLRIAGCLERRENGKVLLKDLPLVALAPGSRPPTESVQDVQHTGFFQAVVKNAHTRMHADGNRAWRSQARLHKLKFSSVSHSKMQFTKKVGTQRLLTGTQKLDGFWKLLKKFVPTQIRTRDLRDRRICKQVLEHEKLHVETQCRCQPLDSAWRFSAKNLLKKNKTGLHETTQIPSKNGFMLPRLANSVKNEKRGFKPDVQIRGNSHVSSRELRKKRCVFEGVANDAVAIFANDGPTLDDSKAQFATLMDKEYTMFLTTRGSPRVGFLSNL